MKKFITILIAILLLLSSMTVSAETDYAYNVSLCYDGDAYSVDYVFGVPDGVEVLSVSVSDANCFYDWNYVKSEARLYLSLASGDVIPRAKNIATIAADKENVVFEIISFKVNGLVNNEANPTHNHVIDKAVAPTCNETGLTEGSHCSVCNAVLVAQQVIPATGHTTVADKAVVPTCKETGLTEGSHCSVCSDVLVAQQVVPANGHTIVTDKAVAPTCTETG